MADDPLTIPDWLGRPQPLARKALELTSSGGGGVTAPVTPGVTGPGGTLAGGGLVPPTPSPTPGSQLAHDILAGVGLAKSSANVIDRLFGTPASPDVSGTPNPVTPEAPPIAGPEGIEGAVSQIPSSSVPAGTAAAESAATFGADAASSAPAGDVAGAGEALGVAGAAAGLGLGLAGIAQSNLSDRDKAAMAAHQAIRTAADIAGFGIPSLVDQVIQLFGGPSGSSLFADLFGIGGGSYWPTRQAAAQEAGVDLSSLSGVYRTAAESGDPAQVLTALSTTEGARGAVRSALSLPPEVATTLGLPSPSVEWSALSPTQFQGVLDYFAQDPSRLGTGYQGPGVTGSGDVGYLPQEQAVQVATNAADQARALIQFMLSQRAAAPMPTAPETAAATPSRTVAGREQGGAAMPPATMTPEGPSRALGFATDLLTT